MRVLVGDPGLGKASITPSIELFWRDSAQIPAEMVSEKQSRAGHEIVHQFVCNFGMARVTAAFPRRSTCNGSNNFR
jgi:hypothetical protein